MTTELPQLYTEREAAKILGLSARTLRDLRAKGEIRYVRLSARIIRYAATDIAEYIERHTFLDTPYRPTANPGKIVRRNDRKIAQEYERVLAQHRKR
ncbi:MAG TPA: helix-turn-helix domain-containing protein [Croceibacterium sp.]